jgi:hypothetical protein
VQQSLSLSVDQIYRFDEDPETAWDWESAGAKGS